MKSVSAVVCLAFGLLTILSVNQASAARVPGYQPYYHYRPLPEFQQRYQALDEMEIIPIVCPLEEDTIDGIPITFTNGSCHDLENPNEGASNMVHMRLLDPTFIDGRSQPNGNNRPSARVISNEAAQLQDGLDPNIKLSSRLLIFFGQFMDHDFALVLEQEPEEGEDEDEEGDEDAIPELGGEQMPIDIPEGDAVFDSEEPMEFPRSVFCLDEEFVRRFPVSNTPWLDLGTVYGDTQNRTDMLREFEGGLMRTQEIDNADFPPFDDMDMFFCGDIRCEENTMLLAWHTLWLRNHNYFAEAYADAVPDALDEEIFQNARIRNINEYQFIVWEQYLPYLLGRRTFFELTGEYELDLDEEPTCTLIFTSAVFRYGHSGVSNDLQFVDENGNTAAPTVALADAFFNPDPLIEDNERIGEMFIGQSMIAHDQLDAMCVSGIRDSLFANVPMFEPGFDLIARNIQRGRDHGIDTINAYREEFGLEPYECPDDPMDCFNQITTNTETAQTLFELYEDISECEMFICGMAEDNYEDSLLGETFTTIMADQFNRMRSADRIWYENTIDILSDPDIPVPLDFPVTLVDIIERNTEVDDFPLDNAFMVENVWVAFAAEDSYQVEWFLPPNLRDQIDDYTVISTSDAGTSSETVDEDSLLFLMVTNAESNTVYNVEVVANLENGESESLGTTSLQTGGVGGGPFPVGAIVGIAVGGGVLVLAVAGVFVYARKNPYSSVGRVFSGNTDQQNFL